MALSSDKISDIIYKFKTEFYFVYDKKYNWSISKDENDHYFLHLYHKNDMTIQELSEYTSWETYTFKSYVSSDYDSHEIESFAYLYNIIEEKESGIDHILNDILSDF
ncbi:hypothetical protein [Pedobacter sp. D749]|uniref:hypothetical protein n=1 Tax=Pedobacter sp. D749 TaxID=2856523 RepID=UPI001C568E7E|nr:hypothetical protein [Pedobacter sp. D749]QXU39997.1 hypothetical protein KYH19_13310 [Pedobacter sp. D749]